MNQIFGIPANSFLMFLGGGMGLILLFVLYTAIRYPLPFRLGIRNIPRRKGQTGLILIGLALSTLIITSALSIGDTVDYSVKSSVYTELDTIDMQISLNQVESNKGVSFGSAPVKTDGVEDWFSAQEVENQDQLINEPLIDGVVPILSQFLPITNEDSRLSAAAVEVRGIGEIQGAGFAPLVGLDSLIEGQVLINEQLALILDAEVGDQLLLINQFPTAVTVGGIVPDGGLAGAGAAVIFPLKEGQQFFDKGDQLTAILLSLTGDVEDGVKGTDEVILALEGTLSSLRLSPLKADQLESASSGAEFITSLFVTFGTFSILAGILLIFVIFSVLAAARQSELGMSRAVGLQRSDLIRQFVSEGVAYDFMAALIGAGLGVLAAFILASSISSLIGTGTEIAPRISFRSILIGYSLGVVVTFVTVVISAVRISKINIIAAIRSLPLPPTVRASQKSLFLRPFQLMKEGVALLLSGDFKGSVQLGRLLWDAILTFWSALFVRGPILIGLGYLLAWVGVNQAEQIGVYGIGVSLFFIGVGQLLAWLFLSERLANSLTGLSLVIYWAFGFNSYGELDQLGRNPGDFFISGLFLIAGAIILFLFNSEALLNLFAAVLGRFGKLLPVARMAIAYPVMAKGRTATTLAMFSLIVFTLVSTTTITNTFSNFLDPETGSGGYELMIQTNPFNPVGKEAIESGVISLVDEGEIVSPKVLASSTFAPVMAQVSGMEKMVGYAINGVDATFLETHNLELSGFAEGYADETAVWAALASDPTLMVIDNFSIDRTGDPTFQPNEDSFMVRELKANESGFAPVPVDIQGVDGEMERFYIIGMLGSAPSFYGGMMNEAGAARLGYEGANRYYFRLPAGADARTFGNGIKAYFAQAGVQATLLKEVLEESRTAIRSVFYLIQGFIGLGLFIGVAALGVVTIRAVVERRQQIGVLRAIGFQKSMIQQIFLFEGLFIAGLGTLIGYILALTFAYNLYLEVAASQGLKFSPPWMILSAIAGTIFISSLITTWLPARATANVVIADALRYE